MGSCRLARTRLSQCLTHGLAVFVVLLTVLCILAPRAHAEDGFLDPSVAFKFHSSEIPGAIKLDYQIADGYYLYREQFKFAVAGQAQSDTSSSAAGGVTLGAPQLPAGHVKFDQVFNKNVETYRGDLSITLPVQHAQGPFDLIVTSQGCSDKGVCYPPAQHTVHVAGVALSSSSASAVAAVNEGVIQGSDRLYDQNYASSVLAGRSLPVVLGIFFVLGMALSLMPCSLPMIPILSSIILGEGAALTRRRGFLLSLSYVLGMAVVYTVFGIAAALAGQSLGALLQNPWVLCAFALLLVVFALSLLGCYALQLPAAWQGRVSQASQRLPGGKMFAVFAMGALSGLVVGACMTAPLFGVLAFIAQTGNVWLGGASLFVMGLGIGVPLLVVGVGAGSILPRAGTWMEGIKRAFGVLLSGVAVWIVAPVLPGSANLVLWALVLLLAAGCLNTFRAAGVATHIAYGWRGVGRAIGALAAVFALALIVGAAAGARDPLYPLAVFVSSGSVSGGGAPGSSPANTSNTGVGKAGDPSAPVFAQVRNLAQLQQATATAGQPSMLFFHADWCTSCLEMERFVFTDPKVRDTMKHLNLIQADVTANNADDQALLKHFNLFGPPAIMFFDAQGHEMKNMRVMGYQPAERFNATLASVISVGAPSADPASVASSTASPVALSSASSAVSSASSTLGQVLEDHAAGLSSNKVSVLLPALLGPSKGH